MGSETRANRHGLSRRIPSEIEREIRRQCGFGCVVCGCLIYTYEHIDPEFKDAKEHDPAKMALLCEKCHGHVTHRRWSKEKIKEARENPKCKQQGFASESEWFDFGDGLPQIKVGGAQFLFSTCILRIFGQQLLAIRPPDEAGGPPRITGLFYDRDGNPTLTIEDNHWKVDGGVWDVTVIGPTITIRRGPGDIALVLRTEARRLISIDRMEMMFHCVRVFADSRGFCVGQGNELCGFNGWIMGANYCCIDVSFDLGDPISGVAITPGLEPPRGLSIQGCLFDTALYFRERGLVVAIGRGDVTSLCGDAVRVPWTP
jgi:hypothetical protein